MLTMKGNRVKCFCPAFWQKKPDFVTLTVLVSELPARGHSSLGSVNAYAKAFPVQALNTHKGRA